MPACAIAGTVSPTRAALARASSSSSTRQWQQFKKRWKPPRTSPVRRWRMPLSASGEPTYAASTRTAESAFERARAIPLPADREILHLLPQEFILDDQSGVHDPLGMMAARLEVRVHMVTAATSATQNVITAVNRAGVHVDDTVFEPLAAADSVLRNDDRELGVCLADIGAGSTELIVFQQGAVAFTGVIPVGGDHFTSDLSVGLCTPLAEAEKIKKIYGNAIVTLIPEGNEVEVPSVGDRPSRLMPQRLVAEILEPRARELFEMMRDNLRQSGMFDVCIAGIVLTGGASRLPGIFDVAESVLRRSVRLSWPAPLPKMPST